VRKKTTGNKEKKKNVLQLLNRPRKMKTNSAISDDFLVVNTNQQNQWEWWNVFPRNSKLKGYVEVGYFEGRMTTYC